MTTKRTPAKRNGKPKKNSKPAEPVLRKRPNGSGILTGGVPGHRGGPGRPPNELRDAIRKLGWDALREVVRRVEHSKRQVPPRAELEKLEKEQLIVMLCDIGEWIEITPGALRQILDTAFKYGVGTKHVHSTEEEGPLEILIRYER